MSEFSACFIYMSQPVTHADYDQASKLELVFVLVLLSEGFWWREMTIFEILWRKKASDAL